MRRLPLRDRKPAVLGPWFVAVFLSALVSLSAPAPGMGEVSGEQRGGAQALPRVLGEADVRLYRRIFELQEQGAWAQADGLIGQLDAPLLMGHVLAQRYLHPTKYRSRYRELKAWMDSYADHPEAQRIYKLALRRRPANWRHPKPPKVLTATASTETLTDAEKQPKRTVSRRARTIKGTLRRYLRKGWTKAVKRTLQAAETKRLLSDEDYDYYRSALALAYLVDGRDAWAIQWAEEAAERSRHVVPEADWVLGLAHWRQGDREQATAHFEKLGGSEHAKAWLGAAGAFWAARGHLVLGRPARVSGWLEKAHAHPRTFYGILAGRLLGRKIDFSWDQPVGDLASVERLLANPMGRRALGLIEVGQRRRAENELWAYFKAAGPASAEAALVAANHADLARLSYRVSVASFNEDGPIRAAYPVPHWKPKEGFKIDRALVYGLMRRESAFNPRAKSHAGARGLLQIMPRTAGWVIKDRNLHRSSRKRRTLFDPHVNLDIGQRYLQLLLEEEAINGDLLRLTASWNGGPGNLRKWLKSQNHQGDPLMFMETIPLRETRNFVERVLTNLWIYRNRLGQPIPSLDAVAAGRWPVYSHLDENGLMVAEDVEN